MEVGDDVTLQQTPFGESALTHAEKNRNFLLKVVYKKELHLHCNKGGLNGPKPRENGRKE